MTTTLLAVDGTLVHGLELNPNMQKADGTFVREGRTDTHYRSWGISDRHSRMIRVNEGGVHVDVEIWQLPLTSFAELSMNEPEGLTIGRVKLVDGSEVSGVLAEGWLTEGQREITAPGGWCKYIESSHTM